MKFMVTRTSDWIGEKSPCPGARREGYVRIDERTANDPTKIPANKGSDGGWYSEGRNHRVERGHIMRDFDDEGWFIEIPDLDALMAFYAKHGPLVMEQCYHNHTINQIEIYDGYRE